MKNQFTTIPVAVAAEEWYAGVGSYATPSQQLRERQRRQKWPGRRARCVRGVDDVEGGCSAAEVRNQHMLRIAARSREVGRPHQRCPLLSDDRRRKFVFRLCAKVVRVGGSRDRLGRLAHQERLLKPKQVEEKVETAREKSRPGSQARELFRAAANRRWRRALVSIVDLKRYEPQRPRNDGTHRIGCTIG
jgi:hypothetical protein